MKRYYLDVITGTIQGGSGGIVEYEIDADGFDYNNGCYIFKKDNGTYSPIIVASYPINRTIIKRIEEV